MKTPKNKYSGKCRVGTALVVAAALVAALVLGCKQEADPELSASPTQGTVQEGSSSGGTSSGNGGGGTGVYKDFHNYPIGRASPTGKLTVTNSEDKDVLLFSGFQDGEIDGADYVGTVPGGSSGITIELDPGKFHVLVSIAKTDYEEKGFQAAQNSTLVYYSDIQKYRVSVSPSRLSGGNGRWIFNNFTKYWVSIENVNLSGETFAVISPEAQGVTIPIEVGEAYDYRIVYKKELKYDNKIVAVADATYRSQNNSFQLKEDNPQHTTTLDPADKTALADSLAPSVLFTNGTGKGVRFYLGNKQLSDIGASGSLAEDYLVNDGESIMITGFTADTTNFTNLKLWTSSWDDVNCTISNTTLDNANLTTDKMMKKGKVYLINVSNSGTDTEPNIQYTITTKPASEYYDE